jgi:hypothetical protein
METTETTENSMPSAFNSDLETRIREVLKGITEHKLYTMKDAENLGTECSEPQNS